MVFCGEPRRTNSRPSVDGGTVIEYEEAILGFGSQGLSVTQDVLILSDGCCDGFVFRFERAP